MGYGGDTTSIELEKGIEVNWRRVESEDTVPTREQSGIHLTLPMPLDQARLHEIHLHSAQRPKVSQSAL